MIYTDFDFVLNDYSKALLDAVEKLFNIKAKTKYELSIRKAQKCSDPLFNFGESIGLSPKEMIKAIELADQNETFNPTPFAKYLIKFFKKEIKKGRKIKIVTARIRRHGILKMANDIFPETKIPVFQCDSKFKHLIIEDGSWYFEDNPKAANLCAKERPQTKVIVPKWKWNEKMIENLPNIFHLNHSKFKDIEKILQNGKKRIAIAKSV